MQLVEARRLYFTEERKIEMFTVKRGMDATEYGTIKLPINPCLLQEEGICAHDVSWKFGGKQYVESKGAKISLKCLPSRGKIFLELTTDAVSPVLFEITAQHVV